MKMTAMITFLLLFFALVLDFVTLTILNIEYHKKYVTTRYLFMVEVIKLKENCKDQTRTS